MRAARSSTALLLPINGARLLRAWPVLASSMAADIKIYSQPNHSNVFSNIQFYSGLHLEY